MKKNKNTEFENFFSDSSKNELKETLNKHNFSLIKVTQEDCKELTCFNTETLKSHWIIECCMYNFLENTFDFPMIRSIEYLTHINKHKIKDIKVNETLFTSKISGEIIDFNDSYDISTSEHHIVYEFFCNDGSLLVGFILHTP